MTGRVLFLLGVWALGCGGGDDGAGPPVAADSDGGDGRGSRECMDEDGDGFGRYCGTNKADCDDTDPDVTDECRRCVRPNKGCPCEPGTMPEPGCDPEDMRVTMNGVTGIVVCSEGTRYCRDGAWSDCEVLWQYATFVPDE